MRHAAPFLFIALILALGFLPVANAHAGDIPLGEPFTLAPGETVHVGDLPLVVQFVEVLMDSRCPSDVTCFWEGEATTQLNLATPGGESLPVELHTQGSPLGDSAAEYAGHVIVLRQVSPYPSVAAPIEAGDYRVELVVERASVLPTAASSWSVIKACFR